MGLKHGKYIYVDRLDGTFVKVRVLNIRFHKKTEEKIDVTNPTRYIVTGVVSERPPRKAVVISIEALPEEVKNAIRSIA
ncbi:MAG: DUF5622 domain-containing protein [Thermosphaera sp.]